MLSAVRVMTQRSQQASRVRQPDDDARVLSGPVDRGRDALAAWDVHISRDGQTGEVIHPALVYVLDRDGRVAFTATGGGAYAAELVGRLYGGRQGAGSPTVTRR